MSQLPKPQRLDSDLKFVLFSQNMNDTTEDFQSKIQQIELKAEQSEAKLSNQSKQQLMAVSKTLQTDKMLQIIKNFSVVQKNVALLCSSS